ncbi:MAG: DUF4097 family beta strand repeat protein [Anaerolineales bacterium]|nr:DUF4097 family beta strand repeat protein [Anaerolineales bacterium]
MSEQEVFEQVFVVDAPARLTVHNVRGSVEIKPGEDDKIKVHAVRDNLSGAPELTLVNISQADDGGVIAEARYDKPYLVPLLFAKPCKVHFVIETPRSVSINAKCVSSSLDVQSLEGNFKLKTVSGSLTARDLSGDVYLKSVSGRILGERISGPVDIDNVSGVIQLPDGDFPELAVKNVSGNIEAGTPIGAGPYVLTTVSGKITLRVPAGTRCSVSGKSVSGRFLTALPATSLHTSKRHWNVEIGGGGAEVIMKTVSGNCQLVTPENQHAVEPYLKVVPRPNRIDLLKQLENGEKSVDEGLAQL